MNKYVCFAIVLILFSCKKETIENPSVQPIPTLTHIPLAINNYWVYNHYSIDTLFGIDTLLNQTDSIVITRDSVYKGKNYFVRMGKSLVLNNGTFGYIDMVRDSLGYLVNEYGVILFSELNFNDTLHTAAFVLGNNDTLADFNYYMEEYSNAISTPSGIYNVGLNYVESIHLRQDSLTRNNANVFVKDVGLVYKTWFFAGSPSHKWFELRLSKFGVL